MLTGMFTASIGMQHHIITGNHAYDTPVTSLSYAAQCHLPKLTLGAFR
jgi:hypothetical protein